jgi:hypothetical protein
MRFITITLFRSRRPWALSQPGPRHSTPATAVQRSTLVEMVAGPLVVSTLNGRAAATREMTSSRLCGHRAAVQCDVYREAFKDARSTQRALPSVSHFDL